jgi:hypothetical protein
MIHPAQDLAGNIVERYANDSNTAGTPVLIVAAAATDNVERTGPTIDRVVNGAMADSAVIATSFRMALTAADTLTLRHRIQESDDAAVWAAAEQIEAVTVYATGGGGGTNEAGVTDIRLDLRGRRRYLRLLVTADLSAGAADTGHYHSVITLGGFDRLPR